MNPIEKSPVFVKIQTKGQLSEKVREATIAGALIYHDSKNHIVVATMNRLTLFRAVANTDLTWIIFYNSELYPQK